MCDYGRRHLVMTNRGVRAEAPLIRVDGELEPASWNEALTWIAGRLEAGDGSAVVSGGAANESLFYLRGLLSELGIDGGTFRVLQGEEITLPGFPKLKLRADRAPNVTGAELHGFKRSDELPDVPDGAVLIVLGDALADAPADYGANAGFFLCVGSHLYPAMVNATAILPMASVLEMEGTFVNFEGRVQRFHQALRAPGVARPAWMSLSRLLEHRGVGKGVLDVRAAFQTMAAGTTGMEDLSWAGLGLRGELLSEAGQPAVAVE
jgi:NADH dehydrogenase/NADH:ubiquinone oxidoreductase subunit G